MARRIKEANIKYISLVPRGANRLPVIYKADGALDVEMLLKVSDDFMEKGELTAVVYAPEFRDSQGDIASAAVVKDMAYKAAKSGLSIDIRHDSKAITKDQAFVAENFIIQKGDPRFSDMKDYSGNKVDVTGAWAVVLKVEDKDLRQLYKENKWNGVSMAGEAVMETDKADTALAEQVIKGLAQRMGLKGDDMDAKETTELVNKAVADSLKTVVADVVKALKAETVVAPVVKEEAVTKVPVFKGDPSKPEDVKAHVEALKRYELAKGVDWSNAESVEKYHAELAKISAVTGKNDAEKEALKKSNQPAEGEGSLTGSASHVSKADQDCFKIGSAMAKYANGGK